MPILSDQERIGTLVAGKYRLDRILGRGGMGVVFAATHTWTDREVAVKLLNPEFARDASVVKRFLQEAKTAASLKHRNVVDVLDMGQDTDGGVYLALEHLHGEPLSARIDRAGSITPEETVGLILPVLDALAKAHAKGIVHRDLKPDNIYLSVDSHGELIPKLLDFGIAKVLDGNASAQTAAGTIVGTPYYMSPEQASAKTTLGPPADVWSMGVVLYQCLTGTIPFTADTPTGVLVAILTTRAPSLVSSGGALPEGVAAAVDRALDPDLGSRFKDAGELAAALRVAMPGIAAARPLTGRQPAVTKDPSAATQPETPFNWTSPGTAVPLTRRRARAPLYGAVAVLVVAALGVTGWLATRGGDETPTVITPPAATPPQEEAPPVPTVAPSLPIAVPSPPLPAVPVAAPDAGVAVHGAHHGIHAHAPPQDAPHPPSPPNSSTGANQSVIID